MVVLMIFPSFHIAREYGRTDDFPFDYGLDEIPFDSKENSQYDHISLKIKSASVTEVKHRNLFLQQSVDWTALCMIGSRQR